MLMSHRTYRKLKGFIALSFCTFSAFLGLFWLVFILSDVVIMGFSSLNLSLLINDPAPPGELGGGLRNAFVGQLLITFFAALIGIPIGILGGTYLAEYSYDSKLSHAISTLADIMGSVPSIVIGTFIYAILVKPFGHFSGWAGAAALATIMIPVVMRTTENMLKLVSWKLREAAFALGAPYYKIIIQIVYRQAATGILTGILLAIARIAGETAPLLFTSFNNSFFSMNMNAPMASLTVSIFQYATSPYETWQSQAWAASFLITFFILILNIVGKYVINWKYQT